jgi:hypothetical protein
MQFYRIKNWQDIYEKNRTRELKNIKWIALPVNLSGDGYCRIMEDKKNGPIIFGCFISIIELAANCDPRGTLIRSTGEPHTFESIGRICRIETPHIEKTISFCVNILKWIEIIDIDINCGISAQVCGITAERPVLPVMSVMSSSSSVPSSSSFENSKHGKRSIIFIPPSFEEFSSYCKENGFENIADRAFKGYSAGNWHDSHGSKIRNWKQKLQHVWFREDNGKSGTGQRQGGFGKSNAGRPGYDGSGNALGAAAKPGEFDEGIITLEGVPDHR